MNVAVLGLGYVGCVSAACLAEKGHRVFGVDVNPVKADLINCGKSPIVEKYVGEIFAEAVAKANLSAGTDTEAAISRTECSLICVGTPSRDNGSLNLEYIENVAREIGRALVRRQTHYTVAIRSTMLPGSAESSVIPLIEQESGKQVGEDFDVYLYPEFLREGSAVEDYKHPPFTLIGSRNGDTKRHLEPLYRDLDAEVFHTSLRSAEMVKYVSNAFHALKVSFANEIGIVCKALGIDSHEVMEVFAKDMQLNISAKYLRPGFAFGGSCLPKDVRALVHRARSLDLDPPLLQSILPSNDRHIDYAFQMICRCGRKKVGIVGLSFKSATDDLRESPLVTLVEKLIGKGYDVRIYDESVSMAKLMGANKQYIEQVIPHVSSLLVSDIDALIDHSEVIVLGKSVPEARETLAKSNPNQKVIDLVRIEKDLPKIQGDYQGLCW